VPAITTVELTETYAKSASDARQKFKYGDTKYWVFEGTISKIEKGDPAWAFKSIWLDGAKNADGKATQVEWRVMQFAVPMLQKGKYEEGKPVRVYGEVLMDESADKLAITGWIVPEGFGK